jgi:hypothetical protein
MKYGIYTTKCKTKDGTIYDIGSRIYPPKHVHDGHTTCVECLVVNAWTEREVDNENT